MSIRRGKFSQMSWALLHQEVIKQEWSDMDVVPIKKTKSVS
uniref:Uncharacterized protein n=1 Tax=Anguilla anguilla TaxID=7936 RepID=A0A0E9P7I8_ANGAN